MVDVVLTGINGIEAWKEGESLVDMAQSGSAGDARATDIVLAVLTALQQEINDKAEHYIEEVGGSDEVNSYHNLLRPFHECLAQDDLPANLRTLFTFALEQKYLPAARKPVLMHPHAHHYNLEKQKDGSVVVHNLQLAELPIAIHFANAVAINPALPTDEKYIPLNEKRYAGVIQKIADRTGETFQATADMALNGILAILARRTRFGKPNDGQFDAGYFLEIARIASKVADSGLDDDLFLPEMSPPKVA